MATETLHEKKLVWAARIQLARHRQRWAMETLRVLERVRTDPSLANAHRLHEVHAEHERQHGKDESASRAQERAERAEIRQALSARVAEIR